MEEKEIRSIMTEFVRKMRRAGLQSAVGKTIALADKNGKRELVLLDIKRSRDYALMFPYPDDLPEKQDEATYTLAGIVYRKLQFRAGNLKVAQNRPADARWKNRS